MRQPGGKYKRLKHRGGSEEKCGAEVTQTKVRRERMGHIIRLRTVRPHLFPEVPAIAPSGAGHMTLRDIERVVISKYYVVTDPGMTPLESSPCRKTTRREDQRVRR
jgi:DNA-directed RNA polymerase subunit beta'